MTIEIVKDHYGSLHAVTDGRHLFQFEYRDGRWYFWLRGESASREFVGPKEDFPWQYFKHACTAIVFLAEDIWDEEIIINKGKQHI